MVSSDSLPIISSKDIISFTVATVTLNAKESEIHSTAEKLTTGMSAVDPEILNKNEALEDVPYNAIECLPCLSR